MLILLWGCAVPAEPSCQAFDFSGGRRISWCNRRKPVAQRIRTGLLFLPCAVLGPVLLVALLRLAAIFFVEVILDLRKASSEGRRRPRNSASLRRRRRRGVEFILGGLQHAGRTYAVERLPTGVLVGGGHLASGAVE